MSILSLQDSEQHEEAVGPVDEAERWASQHEPHPIFQPGVKVRVAFEDLAHKLRYGKTGQVVGHSKGEVLVQLEQPFVPFVFDAKLLLSTAESPNYTPLKTFKNTTISLKRDMLRVLGISDPTAYKIEVYQTKREMISDAELDILGCCCRWALGFDEVRQLQYVDCQLTTLLVEGFLEIPNSQGMQVPEDHLKRMRAFQWMHEVSELLIIPIFSKSSPLHFSVLVIDKKNEPTVRYYESLVKMHEGCLVAARALLAILGIDAEIEQSFNVSRQQGCECGFFASHYIEDEMRGFQNGRGQVPWPSPGRIEKIKEHLSKLVSSLESARQAWQAEWEKQLLEAEKTDRVAAAKAVRAMSKRKLLDEAFTKNAQAALVYLNRGEGAEDPKLPAGFGVKVRVSKKKVEEKVEGASKTKLWQEQKLKEMKPGEETKKDEKKEVEEKREDTKKGEGEGGEERGGEGG